MNNILFISQSIETPQAVVNGSFDISFSTDFDVNGQKQLNFSLSKRKNYTIIYQKLNVRTMQRTLLHITQINYCLALGSKKLVAAETNNYMCDDERFEGV